ncbi:MAG: glycosyltransferase family 2 protein [Candidatus Riflebacteria bacterium]|nr:glycosyltransferase family 2 protein [Candidatus Riflebacteria bacterium]
MLPVTAASNATCGLALSVVIPVYDEADNLEQLHERVLGGLSGFERPFEILYVDDGSHDRSPEILRRLAGCCPAVRTLLFKRNFGQTAALTAGFDHARGEVVVTLDADLQNDPYDIPRVLRKLDEGFDVVSGWRVNRKDNRVLRTLPSMAANWLIGWVTGLPLHDYGCTLKAYRRSVFEELRLYGEMHRFIPAYAYWSGARVVEVEVTHHPRTAGQSKYGLSRTVKVLLDLLTMTFLHSYATKPLYVFGGFGALLLATATATGLFVMVRHFLWQGEWMSPLILVTFFLVVGGMQAVLMGLLAEMMVRTYHESQGKPTYALREIVGTGPSGGPVPPAGQVDFASQPEVSAPAPSAP